MKTMRLFFIYHSFLLKKWYLIVYILGLFLVLLTSSFAIQSVKQDDKRFDIGVVNLDDAEETQMISKQITETAHLGKHSKIIEMTQDEAERALEAKRIKGYVVFERDMMARFAEDGDLPITVHTYDKSSLDAKMIYSVTDSVYQRFMMMMGGGLAYQDLSTSDNDENLTQMLMDLLVKGLNQKGAFELESIELYDTAQYYTVSLFVVSMFILMSTMVSILNMNQSQALQDRMAMYHFAKEKIIFVNVTIAAIYTLIWAIIGLVLIVNGMDVAYEGYNLGPLIVLVSYNILSLYMLFMLIELIERAFVKMIIKVSLMICIVVLSGATIPFVYLKDTVGGVLQYLPFQYVNEQFLELLLHNYLIDTPIAFVCVIGLLGVSTCGVYVWRYLR
ncbi:ABC transporter permease [Staphylococcus massiliensis]|nr:ABC transporter permease [Staphylococcus massiliensis]